MGAPRRETPPAAAALIAAACAVHHEVDAQDERMARRRVLWKDAWAAGATHRAIAAECGVSEALVKMEIAKALGRPWALAMMPDRN